MAVLSHIDLDRTHKSRETAYLANLSAKVPTIFKEHKKVYNIIYTRVDCIFILLSVSIQLASAIYMKILFCQELFQGYKSIADDTTEFFSLWLFFYESS